MNKPRYHYGITREMAPYQIVINHRKSKQIDAINDNAEYEKPGAWARLLDFINRARTHREAMRQLRVELEGSRASKSKEKGDA